MLFVIQSWLFRSSLLLWTVIDNLIFGRRADLKFPDLSMTRRSQPSSRPESQSGPETESMRVIMIQFTFWIINKPSHIKRRISVAWRAGQPHRNLQTLTLSGVRIKIPLKCHRSLLVYYEGVGLLLSWMVGAPRIHEYQPSVTHTYAAQCSGWGKTALARRYFKSSEYCMFIWISLSFLNVKIDCWA